MRVPLPALALAVSTAVSAFAAAGRNWPAYLGDKSASHYSALSQITPENVAKLPTAILNRIGEILAGEADPT